MPSHLGLPPRVPPYFVRPHFVPPRIIPPHRTRVPHAVVACCRGLFALAVAALALRGPLVAAEAVVTPSRPPNVVLILADDLGWSDTTLYGTTTLYQTPNIERLAARGMTFTRAYASSPLCSPTRASILTGQSPARHGITAPNCHTPKVALTAVAKSTGPPQRFSTVPDSVTRLDTQHYTLAEMLRDNGYATGHFGKWHLGPEPWSPREHGFDVDIPHHPGPGPAGSYVAPWKFADFDHDPDIPNEHIEDRMAKEAVAFLERHRQRPFFLNYWMFSVHAPFDAKPALINKYKGMIDPQAAQRSPTYAAMVRSMDHAVGTLLDTFDRLQLADNTIIIFASDNGGNMYNLVDGGTATSNAPLRGGKATMFEGGVRGPAVVVHPGTVSAGTRSHEIIQSSDFYPTLLELLQLPSPPDQTFDGISIVPALRGGSLKRDGIFTYFPHNPSVPDWLPPAVSVHSGDWKLIRIFHGGEQAAHRYLLYNLNNDVGEQHNLADQFPERVRQLDAAIEAHLENTRAVRPLPNPRFDPALYDPAQEGVAALKGSGNKASVNHGGRNNVGGSKGQMTKRVRPQQPLVAGWQSGGTCQLTAGTSQQDRPALTVASDGRDPYFSHVLTKPLPPQTLTLTFSMNSTSSGRGQFFWKENHQPRFAADRSEHFDVTHDGQWHTYRISFSVQAPLAAVRLDPSRGPGKIRLTDIRLITADGTDIDLLPRP